MSTYNNQLLRINLTTGAIRAEPIPEQVKTDFVGGRGFGIKYLYDELAPGIEPLGPENKLLFLAGPLGGTAAQGFSKWVAVTKSPLTGCVARALGGGDFGAHLKFAGFDFVVVEGQAETPIYIHLEGNKAEVLDAGDLWGLDTQEAQQKLQEKHGPRTQVACIGLAGEKLVRYATITHGRRTASRCGVGTVMGSKNLKAVAIGRISESASQRTGGRGARGKLVPHDPDGFRSLAQEQIESLKTHKRRLNLTNVGTTFMVATANTAGMFPTRNFREGSLEGFEKIAAEEFSRVKVGNFGCYSCMTRCGQVHEMSEGPYSGAFSEGPEYETIWALGGQVGNTDSGFLVAADARCDLLGLDTISTGNCIGFACELFERGIITTADTDGLELTWGNHAAFLTLIEKIGRREGFGELLGEGVVRAARRIGKGAKAYAMHAKGLELPGYAPRAVKGYGLSYATSNIGGSHMYGRPRDELYGRLDPFAEEGKGGSIALVQKEQALDDSVVVCNFGTSGLTRQFLGKLLVAATGINEFRDVAYLDRVGERIVCLERAFNVREGFDRKDDTLPARMFTEPLQNAGPATGQVIRSLDTLLNEYYDALGYTRQGVPSREKLKELGLEEVAKDIFRDA
jgi:aldehyde:ferredoxin oxidoreductase